MELWVPRFDSLGRILTSGEPVPCSRAIISSYAAWFCVGVSIGRMPCYYKPGLDGNDPLLSLWLYSFCFCMVLVLHSRTNALIWG